MDFFNRHRSQALQTRFLILSEASIELDRGADMKWREAGGQRVRQWRPRTKSETSRVLGVGGVMVLLYEDSTSNDVNQGRLGWTLGS